MVCWANWLAQPTPPHTPGASAIPIARSSLERQPTAESWKSRVYRWGKIRKQARHAVRELRSARRNADPATAGFLLLVTALLIFGIGYLTLMASCHLSCNGQEGMAVAVLLGGITLIVSLVWLIWSGQRQKNSGKKQGD